MNTHLAKLVIGCVCAALLVCAQPAAAKVYDANNLSVAVGGDPDDNFLNDQDNWGTWYLGRGHGDIHAFRVFESPYRGNPHPGDGIVIGNWGFADGSGYTHLQFAGRPNDGNWGFDLSGQTHFAIGMSIVTDYMADSYERILGRGEFRISNSTTAKSIGFGIRVEPTYYGVYTQDAAGTEHLGTQPRPPTNPVGTVWDYRLEVDTTANAGDGSGRLYTRRRDNGVPSGWTVVGNLESINLQLAAQGANITAANALSLQIRTGLVAMDNLAVIVPGSLTARAFLDKNMDGVRDAYDEDLAGVPFSITGPYAGTNMPNWGGTTGGAGTISVNNGTTTLSGADDGDYRVTQTALEQYWDLSGTATRAVTVGPGAAVVTPFGQCPIMGDADASGLVDITDFFTLKTSFGLSPKLWIDGNFDDNDLVDISDFFALKGNFGQSHPHYTPAGGAAPTPEPATIGLLALGGMGVLLKRRRR